MPSLQQSSPAGVLTTLFCSIDDFCLAHLPLWKSRLLPCQGKRNRARSLSESEIMTILCAFHLSHYRDFKAFYLGYVHLQWKSAFPNLVSYSRFIEYVPSVLMLLYAYLRSLFGKCSGISFLDSTKIAVCDNHRIHQHKVFKQVAQRGKTSTGWFFGFKLHFLVNDTGEMLNLTLSPGNVDDRRPVPDLIADLFGTIFADKGYVSQKLFDLLYEQDIVLLTKLRKGMKPKLMLLCDRLMLRKRAIIETVIDQLKNISQIEHTRHRAATGFLSNLFGALIAYCHQPKKPTLNIIAPDKQITA